MIKSCFSQLVRISNWEFLVIPILGEEEMKNISYSNWIFKFYEQWICREKSLEISLRFSYQLFQNSKSPLINPNTSPNCSPELIPKFSKATALANLSALSFPSILTFTGIQSKLTIDSCVDARERKCPFFRVHICPWVPKKQLSMQFIAAIESEQNWFLKGRDA